MGKLDNNVCGNCGADEGLHRSETLQCPKNGIEETRFDKLTGKYYPQQWEETTFIGALHKEIESDALKTYQECETMPSQLLRWKKEQMQVTGPLFEFMRGRRDIKYGASLTQASIEFIKERDSLMQVLDIIMAEINSTPMLVQHFDLRIIKRANDLLNPKP